LHLIPERKLVRVKANALRFITAPPILTPLQATLEQIELGALHVLCQFACSSSRFAAYAAIDWNDPSRPSFSDAVDGLRSKYRQLCVQLGLSQGAEPAAAGVDF
jgi:hypothetical protein